MHNTNEMTVEFQSIPQNESFARMAVTAFMSEMNPTLEQIADVKTDLLYGDISREKAIFLSVIII